MPAPQQRVGEYVLEYRLGAGAFGEVWRAHHHVWSNRLVAVKIPLDPAYVRRLQQEGLALHRLNHPNVVPAIAFDPFADPPYLVTEYVPGTSLRPLIAQRSLSIDQAVEVMRQLLRGLASAHAQGVVHRDVKPENILVHERAHAEGFGVQGLVRVADFDLGVASVRAVAESIVYSQSLNEKTGKEVAGTLEYMSPEQRRGEAVDARADLYSCGVVLYELLTGDRPAGTELPSDLNSSVPGHLDDAFRRSYARLDRRFKTAEEFIAALDAPRKVVPPPLPPRIDVRDRLSPPPPPPWRVVPPPIPLRAEPAQPEPATTRPPKPKDVRLFPARGGGGWGYINAEGEMEIEPSFVEARAFSEGLAAVRIKSKWGYVDGKGHVVIPRQFDDAFEFREGLAPVRLFVANCITKDPYGYVDRAGNYVIHPNYVWGGFFSQGLARVQRLDNKVVFLTPQEKEICDGVAYRPKGDFTDVGLALMMVKGKFGYVDTKGQVVIQPQYVDAEEFREGLAPVKIQVQDSTEIFGHGTRAGFIRPDGTWAVEPVFSGLGDLHDGLALAYTKDKRGYVDTAGNWRIELTMNGTPQPFSEGRARIKLGGTPYNNAGGKFGFLDTSGKLVIPPVYDEAAEFHGGLAQVVKEGEWGYIDLDGNAVWGLTGD